MTPAIDFKPSQVNLLGSFPPLVGTFKKAEAEVCATWMVRALALDGDTWRPVTLEDIGLRMKKDAEANVSTFGALARNPFLVPDVHRLIADGFARWIGTKGGPVEFTLAGLEALRKRVLT